ncbi:hypothetical protein AMECASPLE_025025 [Ameca splendens]|uniref:Uncharacterized protein n=1 Tax=Ameca splendens TaxID=208324 RepID=A0ABV0Z2I9_9TELE
MSRVDDAPESMKDLGIHLSCISPVFTLIVQLADVLDSVSIQVCQHSIFEHDTMQQDTQLVFITNTSGLASKLKEKRPGVSIAGERSCADFVVLLRCMPQQLTLRQLLAFLQYQDEAACTLEFIQRERDKGQKRQDCLQEERTSLTFNGTSYRSWQH